MPREEAPEAMLTLPLASISDQVEWQEGAAWGQSPLKQAFPGARPSVARRVAAERAGRGGRREAAGPPAGACHLFSGFEFHTAAMVKVMLSLERAGGASTEITLTLNPEMYVLVRQRRDFIKTSCLWLSCHMVGVYLNVFFKMPPFFRKEIWENFYFTSLENSFIRLSMISRAF